MYKLMPSRALVALNVRLTVSRYGVTEKSASYQYGTVG
jgi:hypothetical protein